jgi:hypothetical protein
MKPGTPILTGATWLFIGFIAVPALAATDPVPGIYQETEFTTAVSGGTAGECDIWGPANTEATPRIFTYPGPRQRGATERAPSIGPGFDFIFIISYPTTPARGVTSWSGTYQADFIPPPPNSSPWTGEFTQSWTFVDASSYVFTGTLSGLPSTKGNFVCEITHQGTAIRTGR